MLVRALALLAVVPFVLGAAAAPSSRQQVAFTIADPQLTEASALVALPGGLFATTNDSGDTGRVFVLDGTGATVGVTHWSQDPTDVEALALAPDDEVWVGDIGDNASSRETVQVAEVPVGRGDRTVAPTVFDLAYPDGAHDAETLLCDPADGRLYVATKGLLGGTLYAAPKHLVAGEVNRLRPVGPVLPIATDGAFWPDGKHVIIRNYFSAAVYDWPSLDRVATFSLPSQPQGEGLGIAADGTVYLSSEGLHSKVLVEPLPQNVEGSLGPAEGSQGPAEGSRRPDSSARPVDSSAWWPWAVAGVVGLGAVGVLVRTLRRR